MSGSFTAACLQLCSAREIEPNIASVRDLARRARDKGADLIMTPEVTDMIEPKRDQVFAKARTEAEHPMLAACREVARETGAWFLLGSVVTKLTEEPRLANRSYLIAPDGADRGALRQDPHVRRRLENGESYRESAFLPARRRGGAGRRCRGACLA